jgi:hypothetical protein
MRMTHSRKIEEYKRQMAEKGIGSATACPPLWLFMWSIGVRIPPPLYMGFLSLTIFSGTFFGVLFGVIAWYMGNKGHRTMSLNEACYVALATGAFFGLSVAWFSRRLARKHRLGSWAAFGKSQLHT